MLTPAELQALILRMACRRQEGARDDYARAVAWHATTRGADWPRGCKMRATFALKRTADRLARLLQEG